MSKPSCHAAIRSVAVFCLFAITGCGGGGGTQDDRDAAKWAIEHGGTVVVSDVTKKITAVEQLPEDSFELLKIELNQIEPPVTDKDLESLPSTPGLMYLGLHSARITDKGVATIAGRRSLEELELSYTEISDNGLEELATLKELKKLFLYGTQVTPEAVDAFKQKHPDCTVYRD